MDQTLPDVYCDGVQVSLSPFDVVLNMTLRPPVPGTSQTARPVGYVRMSLEHAKVMAIILRKLLKQHEEAQGHEIVLHPQVYQQMGLSRQEDW